MTSDILHWQTPRKGNSRHNMRKMMEKRKASELEFLKHKVQRDYALKSPSFWIRDVLWQWLRGNWIQMKCRRRLYRKIPRKIASRSDKLYTACKITKKIVKNVYLRGKIREVFLFSKSANMKMRKFKQKRSSRENFQKKMRITNTLRSILCFLLVLILKAQ